jgi:hypothetical protein
VLAVAGNASTHLLVQERAMRAIRPDGRTVWSRAWPATQGQEFMHVLL